MYQLIKSLLFTMQAEKAHEFTTKSLKALFLIPGVKSIVKSRFVIKDEKLSKEVFGLKFPNPVGLAAGFDKNADYIHEFKAFGFGFIEIGTITPKGQPGNPQPRLFRLVKDRALINRMGFNNEGMDVAIEKLKKRPKNLIIGGNIGKNKVTPNEQATEDYISTFEALFPYVDYFVVNVSSPNTPDLRALQDKEPLTQLLQTLQDLNTKKTEPKPILLKIAPDLNNDQLDDIIEIVSTTGIVGIIATNTTIDRSGLAADEKEIEAIGAGGLSGAPLADRSTEVIRYIKKKNPTLPIIGVGGIMDEKTALEKLEAGADLLQLYTGFVYEGPALIKRINKAILKKVEEG
jgi:dihydroorotate dehydrogenase